MNRLMGVGLVMIFTASCTGKYVRPTTQEKVALTPERLERGRYLVENVAMCGACHDGRTGGTLLGPADPALKLGGGTFLEDGGIEIYVPNITSDAATGVGTWSDDKLIRGIRDGVRPDGTFLFPIMPFGAYQHMSDEDVRAVVAYLRSVPAVKMPRPERENKIPFIFKVALGMGAAQHRPVKNVVAPDPSHRVQYGEYLAYLGHCTECHSLGSRGARTKDDRWMAGSTKPLELKGVGKVWASNLTPSKEGGLGHASAEQIKLALISGRRLDGKAMAPPMSLYTPYMALMKPEDLDALVAYLRALPAVKGQVPPRELTPAYAKLLGE